MFKGEVSILMRPWQLLEGAWHQPYTKTCNSINNEFYSGTSCNESESRYLIRYGSAAF